MDVAESQEEVACSCLNIRFVTDRPLGEERREEGEIATSATGKGESDSEFFASSLPGGNIGGLHTVGDTYAQPRQHGKLVNILADFLLYFSLSHPT